MNIPGLDQDLQRKLDVEVRRPGGCRSCNKSKLVRKYQKLQEARNTTQQNNLDNRRRNR